MSIELPIFIRLCAQFALSAMLLMGAWVSHQQHGLPSAPTDARSTTAGITVIVVLLILGGFYG